MITEAFAHNEDLQFLTDAFLPYLIVEFEGGGFCLLNRHYKPLGLGRDAPWVEYEQFTTQEKFNLDALEIQPGRFKGELRRAFFYDDGTNPRLSVENMERYVSLIEKVYPKENLLLTPRKFERRAAP